VQEDDNEMEEDVEKIEMEDMNEKRKEEGRQLGTKAVTLKR